jgi:hypothetical protein
MPENESATPKQPAPQKPYRIVGVAYQLTDALDKLENEVCEAIKAGYVPHGSPVVTPKLYAQAIILKEVAPCQK